MTSVAWLHLSDWHHRYPMSHDRRVLRDRLLKDVRNRTAISHTLAHINFILFSGDISFSGAKEEFEEVKRELFDPIQKSLGGKIPVYCVPGNHDIERARICRISPKLRSQIAQITTNRTWQEFNEIATQPDTAAELNKPLSNFFAFRKKLRCKCERSKLYSVERIKTNGICIGLVCINTAWNSGRYKLQHADSTSDPWLWDYGLLRITETQLEQAFSELGNVDLGILMMHHPLHWIDEFERAKLEHIIFNHCHIVIHGHEHRPNTSRISSAFGDLVFVPAGATYIGRTPEDPRYTNAYNFTTVDTESFSGTVHHRIWSEDHGRWQADERFWSEGRSQFLLARTKDYDVKLAHKTIINSNKLYMPFIHKRAALEHEIFIGHDAESIGGEQFIRQHLKIRIRLRAGPPEVFTWTTSVDEALVAHPNEAVRKRAYKLLRIAPAMERVKLPKNPKHVFKWETKLDGEQQWVEYECEILDLPSNFLYLAIRRFTDRVRLSIKPALGYKYSYLPIGGFPELQMARNEISSLDTIETDEMILPGQGYIIQWRPERKSMPKSRKAFPDKTQHTGKSKLARHRVMAG